MTTNEQNGDRGRSRLAGFGIPLLISRYCLALVTVAAGWGLRLMLTGWSDQGLPAYITFYPAVMAAALLAGFGPGLLATALSAFAVGYWILPPVGQFAIASPADRVGLALFIGMGILMSAMANLYHQASAKLVEYEHEKEQNARSDKGRLHSPSLNDRSTASFTTMDVLPPMTLLDLRKRTGFDALIAVVFGILVGIGWLIHRDMAATMVADRREAQAYVAIYELGDLLSALTDAETGQHGFIITGEQHYLEPYHSGVSKIETRLPALRQLAMKNPRLQQRLSSIEALATAKLAELKETIELRETKGFQAASEVVIMNSGKNIMDDIRALVGQALRESEREQREQNTAKEERAGKTIHAVLLGTALGSLLLLLLFITLHLELDRRRRAESDLRANQAHLMDLVDERTQELRLEQTNLQTTLQRFHVVLSNMYSAVLLVTDEGRIEFANQAFCDIFGLTDAPAGLAGITAGDMLGKIKNAHKHPDEAVARIREILDLCNPVKGEEVMMDGGKTCLRDFVPLNFGGKSCGLLWLQTDITEQKRTEEELRLLNAELEQRVAAQTAGIRKTNDELEQRVAERAGELRFANDELEASRVAALNLMEDAIVARQQTEKAAAELARQADELRTSNEELTRFNRVAVDRELRMIELKKQVNELCAKAGLPQAYDTTFETK